MYLLAVVPATLARYNPCNRRDHAVRSSGNTTNRLSNGAHDAIDKTLDCEQLISNRFIYDIQKALCRLPQSGVENSTAALLPVATRHTIIFAIVLAIVLATIHEIHLFYSRYIIFTGGVPSIPSLHNLSNSSR